MTQFPDPFSQNQESPNHRHEALSKTDLHWIAPCLTPACCLNVPPTSPWPRVPECSTAQAQATCLLFLTLIKSSFTECRLCQVSEKRQSPANIGYQFCLTFASRVWGVLWTSWTIQTPSVNEMRLLIYSKSHNEKSQRELDKKCMPHSYHASLGLVLSDSSTFLSAHLVNEMLLKLCMKGVMWASRRRGLTAPWSYYWSWPSLWLSLDKGYASTWDSLSFTIDIYLYYLFV